MSVVGSIRVSGSVFIKERQRGSVWYAKWRVNGRQYKRVIGPVAAKGGRPVDGTYTRKMAEAVLQGWLTDARRGAVQDLTARETVTLAAAVDEWLAYVEHERGRSAATARNYRAVANGHFLPALGPDTRVDRITREQIESLRRSLLVDKGLGPATVRKITTLLHACLKYAKRRGWLHTNPCDDVERVSVRSSGDFQVLSPSEVWAVVRHAKHEQDGLLFATAAFTGLRLGELRALRWEDIDFTTSTVHVRRTVSGYSESTPKSGKVRAVPLIDEVARLLDAHSQRTPFSEPHDRVFPSAVGGRQRADAIRDRFYAALDRAGLGDRRTGDRPIRFHDLRHTFGTLAVKVWDLPTVQGYMGHGDIETTMGYIHHVPKQEHAAALSRLVSPSPDSTSKRGTRPTGLPALRRVET